MKSITEIAMDLADKISDFTGYAAVREWTPTPAADEVILDLKPYSQIDSFSCGATAGFSVVKTFKPRAKFETFYATVNPHPENGTSTTRLIKGLRSSGVHVSARSRLSYRELIRQIDGGSPVIVVITNYGADVAHWCVAYGFGTDHVVLSSNGIPWIHRKRYPKKEFLKIWDRSGLICSGKSRRRKRSATR